MTLDPVHVDGIAELAGRVTDRAGETDPTKLAERVWGNFLDPLYDEVGNTVLEPIEELRRRKVQIDDVALTERPFPTQHGLDAGTINPTTFKNGLILDVSQAVMASVPTEIDLHRRRTVVMTVHSNDDTVDVSDQDWRTEDHGYARQRAIQVPRVDRHEQKVVHALALYRAESEHALEQSDSVDDLLILDGPIYPTGLLRWADRDPELKRLIIEESEFVEVVHNYLSLVETFVERDVPLIGFVKNSRAKGITRQMRSKIGAPWVDDEAFFRRILQRTDNDGERKTDALTFTSWFRSRVGTDSTLSDGTISVDREAELDDEDYEVTFCVIYDPREDLVYRVEAPYAFTKDSERREQLTTQVLSEIAAEQGPPLAVSKADELARIDREGKKALKKRIENEFDSEQQRRYNDKRWGDADPNGW